MNAEPLGHVLPTVFASRTCALEAFGTPRALRSDMTRNLEAKQAAQSIAADALAEGRVEDARAILAHAGCSMPRATAKRIARELVKTDRAIAKAALMLAMGAESAETELAPMPVIEVGAIFRCSWGWEQTNIDYYQVVAISGSRLTIREISANYLPSESSQGRDALRPAPNSFKGEPMIRRLQKGYRGQACIKIGDGAGHAYLWDGSIDYATASGYGH